MASQNTYWIYGNGMSKALLISSVATAASMLTVLVVELTVTDSTVQLPTTNLNVGIFSLVVILAVIAILAQAFLWLSMIYFAAATTDRSLGVRVLLVLLQFVLVSLGSLIVYLIDYRPQLSKRAIQPSKA